MGISLGGAPIVVGVATAVCSAPLGVTDGAGSIEPAGGVFEIGGMAEQPMTTSTDATETSARQLFTRLSLNAPSPLDYRRGCRDGIRPASASATSNPG
jgi:hypothetical protein